MINILNSPQGLNWSVNWGGCIFIYPCSALLISFDMNLNKISKGISMAGHEYINTPPS